MSVVATKIALTTFPPLGLGLVRFGMAVVLLGSFLAIRKEIEKTTPGDFGTKRIPGHYRLLFLENVGVKYSTASDAALIVASYPAITMLLETLLFRVKFPVRSFVGVGLVIFGVYMIVSISQSSAAQDYSGTFCLSWLASYGQVTTSSREQWSPIIRCAR